MSLTPRSPFDHGLEQVAERCHGGDDEAENERCVDAPGVDLARDADRYRDRDDTTTDQALPGLVRAHPRGETVPAEEAADRVAAHVVADDGKHRTDHEGDPVAVREDRRVEEQPDEGPEHPDPDEAEHGHREVCHRRSARDPRQVPDHRRRDVDHERGDDRAGTPEVGGDDHGRHRNQRDQRRRLVAPETQRVEQLGGRQRGRDGDQGEHRRRPGEEDTAARRPRNPNPVTVATTGLRAANCSRRLGLDNRPRAAGMAGPGRRRVPPAGDDGRGDLGVGGLAQGRLGGLGDSGTTSSGAAPRARRKPAAAGLTGLRYPFRSHGGRLRRGRTQDDSSSGSRKSYANGSSEDDSS